MANNMERNPPVTTTQRTSKSLKAQLSISLFLLCYGGLTWFVHESDASETLSWPTKLMIIGGLWYILTKIRIWWHHE